jgi:hypothetical protein
MDEKFKTVIGKEIVYGRHGMNNPQHKYCKLQIIEDCMKNEKLKIRA